MKSNNYNFLHLSMNSFSKGFFTVILALFSSFLMAQDWEVPPEKNAEVSPYLFDDAFRNAGAALYSKHCLSCHGEPGKNVPAQLVPLPADPASEKFVKLTDGAMFYKITVGRGLMPRFESVLKEIERWQIIAYIRSFHKGYVQPELAVEVSDGKKKLHLSIAMIDKNTLKAKAYSVEQNDTIPADNVKLVLLMKRYFGNMQLGEAKTTNTNGIATFPIDENLRADTAGMVTFIVRPMNTEIYGDVEAVATLKAGIPNTNPPLNQQRAIWNIVQKTPLWLLFTYVFSVLGVWLTIGYIVLQLLKIKKTSNITNN